LFLLTTETHPPKAVLTESISKSKRVRSANSFPLFALPSKAYDASSIISIYKLSLTTSAMSSMPKLTPKRYINIIALV
jgi:hypothetical protein